MKMAEMNERQLARRMRRVQRTIAKQLPDAVYLITLTAPGPQSGTYTLTNASVDTQQALVDHLVGRSR